MDEWIYYIIYAWIFIIGILISLWWGNKMVKRKATTKAIKNKTYIKEVEVINEYPKEYSAIKKQTWIKKLQNKFFPASVYLINMQLRNGFHNTFLISTNSNSFKYKGGNYVIDETLKYYNINAKCFSIDYHQDLSIPVRREIQIDEIKKAVKNSGLTEEEMSLNPKVLQSFIDSKIAEGVLRGQQIDEFLRMLKLWLVVIGIVVLIHFALFMKASGMLDNLHL